MAHTFGLDHATLHVHVGMVIWVAGVAIAGDVGAAWPLAVVIVAELFNEVLDRLRSGSWRIADTMQDIVNSVLWPVVLFTLARTGVI
jgi:predicted membrane-bound spermidine synthase